MYRIMNEETKTTEWYENQYTPSRWSQKHGNKEAVINHFCTFTATKSKEIQEDTPNDRNVSYGVTNRQKIDYFYGDDSRNKSTNKPVYVYIHGGFWQEGNKDMYSLVISAFTKNNFNTAVIGYDLAPTCSIPQIITQVAEAVDVIFSHFNQSKLILFGHSAGAFLAAAIAAAKSSLIQHIVLISGVYELCPLIGTTINDTLQLTTEQAQDLSSIVSDYNVNVPAHIYVGGDESSEFRKQSQRFYEKLVQNKIPCAFEIVPNEDHFSIIENLVHEESVVCTEMLRLGKATF